MATSSSFLSSPFSIPLRHSFLYSSIPNRRGRDMVVRMGGGPRTFPGGVSKWQWKRMQSKKAAQLLKARLSRERQIYEMRKRVELKEAVSQLERPWEAVKNAPNLFSVSLDEQVKTLADRFQKPGGFDMWNERDGPQVFNTPNESSPSEKFFPKGAVHSIKSYTKEENEDKDELRFDDWIARGAGGIRKTKSRRKKEIENVEGTQGARENVSGRIDFESTQGVRENDSKNVGLEKGVNLSRNSRLRNGSNRRNSSTQGARGKDSGNYISDRINEWEKNVYESAQGVRGNVSKNLGHENGGNLSRNGVNRRNNAIGVGRTQGVHRNVSRNLDKREVKYDKGDDLGRNGSNRRKNGIKGLKPIQRETEGYFERNENRRFRQDRNTLRVRPTSNLHYAEKDE